MDDYAFAIRLCQVLATRGIRVPEDRVVASIAERHNLVRGLPIVVAVRDSVAMGRTAGEKLVALIEGKERGPVVVDLPACVERPPR